MASPHALSSLNPASANSLTSVAAPASTTAPASSTPAPTTSAPAANVTSALASPVQRATTTQVVKSPIGTTSSSNIQDTNTRSKQSSGGPSNTSAASSDSDAAPALPSDSHSGSHAASVGGAVAAILFVVFVLAGSFWLLRRRREKFRRLWESQRMPASLGKYENEITPVNPTSIEATLEADLARLRSLDQRPSMNIQNYDRKFSEPSLNFTPKPVSPGGFKIARKPSYRVKNPVVVLPPSGIGDVDGPFISPTAPAYDDKEYIADFSSKATSTTPTSVTTTPHRNY